MHSKTIALFAAALFLSVSSVATATTIDATSFIDPARVDCGIQKAIDSLGDGGGEVILPEGRFALRRALMLRDHVTLRGQGRGKTTLIAAATNQWTTYTPQDTNRIALDTAMPDIRVNSTVFFWGTRPHTGWLGRVAPCLVTAVDGNVLTIDQGATKKPGHLSFGLCSILTQDCVKGANQLHVADASFFGVGEAIVVGSGDGNANESLSFIQSIDDNTLTLERPIRGEHLIGKHYYWKRPAVWKVFPLITAENVKHVTIADMTLDCPYPADGRPKMRRYTVSPIHLYNAQDSLIENVHVNNSPTDGISLQTGARVTVRNCLVTHCGGSGLHPGTGLKDSVIENNISRENGAGLYFCWHNRGHMIRNNQFIHNGSGLTGLGNPGDRGNTIENNLIAHNRGLGIEINGGVRSDNVIRNNIFRDNSAAEPGKHPAILIAAQNEDALAYTIENNTFENTTAAQCQSAGIEERNGKRNDKPTRADENTIRGNSFRNMHTADVIVVGEKTVVDQPDARIVRKTDDVSE